MRGWEWKLLFACTKFPLTLAWRLFWHASFHKALTLCVQHQVQAVGARPGWRNLRRKIMTMMTKLLRWMTTSFRPRRGAVLSHQNVRILRLSSAHESECYSDPDYDLYLQWTQLKRRRNFRQLKPTSHSKKLKGFRRSSWDDQSSAPMEERTVSHAEFT